MKRCIVSLFVLLIATSLAAAQPFTRRSSQMQHDGLKKTYEISNFRLGGKYDLSDPSKWGKRRRGRYDAGIARRRQATNRLHRDRHAAPQCRWRGSLTRSSSTHTIRVIPPICTSNGSRGTALSGGVPVIGPGQADRYRSLLRHHGRSARDLGRQQAVRRARRKVSAVQLLRHGAGQLSDVARPAQGRARCASGRSVDGRHTDLCLGRQCIRSSSAR